MFTRLDPARTGITVQNPYDDPRMWAGRYREFMGGAMGSGLAAGDFDGDGKLDLYVCTKTAPGRLYRNLGDWKFEDVTAAAGLAESGSVLGWLKHTVTSDTPPIWRQGAVFADVNNDGRLDLFVCRNAAPNLLYINQGDGTFKEEAEARGLGISDGSVIGAFADYDRDGWLDVYIVMNQLDGLEAAGRPGRLFHNNGNGTFTEVTARSGIAGGTFGHSAVWFDYDGDGWPDLYVANDFSGPDRLYRNNHDGTFTNVLDAVVPHTPYSSMGTDTADVDNDGHFDLLVADMATTTREKDRRGLAASRDDVLAMGTREGTAPQYMRNALLLNTGRGFFREAACWAGLDATDWTWSVRFEDFDNDGWQDLQVTNGMVREANNSDLLARMMRALSDMERIGVMKKAPPLEESNLAYRNVHGTGFEPVTAAWGLGEVGVSFGAVTADFDGDGDLDLAYLNYNGGVSVYRNDTVGRHRVQVRLRGTKSNRFGVGAIVRIASASGPQARALTVARGFASGSELVAHFGLGGDTRIDRLAVEWPSGKIDVFTNLDVDCAYLITEGSGADASPPPSPAQPLFASAAPELGGRHDDRSTLAIPDREQAFAPFRTDRRGPGVTVADADGDGREDIYLSATTGSPARLLRWTGRAYAEETVNGLPTPPVEDGPALFLTTGDGAGSDLLVTKASAKAQAWPGAFQPVLYRRGDRGELIPAEQLPALALNAGAVCVADIDGDGDLDLFLGGRSVPGRYPEAPASFLLRNEGGRFVDITSESPALGHVGLVKSALFRDVDQDGRPDLIVALEWDYVRYLHNDGGGRFTDWTERSGFTSGGRGWWNSLACADLNGDGRPDFVAGNLGLNTPYRTTRERPVTLFYGDFAQNGTKVLAEAVYDGATLYPLRPRIDLGARFPFVLRKYPKNDDFARATMAEVFGSAVLASAEVHTVDNFSSGVFLSQPDGTYRFAPLPRVAQIGPIEGVVATDLDGDGIPDICAVQNSDISVPRFDGGVGILLHGNGDGTFAPVEPAASGVVVPGNARALVVVDPLQDGRPSLFLTRHGGASELLLNQTAPGRWLRLELAADPANPHAIGAVVRLVYANGWTSWHEVGLGGGWLSDSGPGIHAVTAVNGGRIVEAVIRWPDGQVSHHGTPPAQGRWLLRKPSSPHP
jgi:hypothetical protein